MNLVDSHKRDVVIDLETVGKRAGCGILSIGAVTLDETRIFTVKIDIESCYDLGFHADHDTLDWWLQQSTEARLRTFGGVCPIGTAMLQFAKWYREEDCTAIWGNGAAFDIPIMTEAFRLTNVQSPWSFRDERCYRTLKALYSHIKAPDADESLTKHVAIDDAIYEARHLKLLLKELYHAS